MLSPFARQKSKQPRNVPGLWMLGPALTGVVLSWSSSASGRFLDCKDIVHNGRVQQVVFGDVGLAPTADPDLAALARIRLGQLLRQQLADLKSSLGMEIHDVQCPGHTPSTTDYTEAIVASRHGDGVLVELWGVRAGQRAAITYVLLPLLPPIRHINTTGFYRVRYDIASQGDIADVFAEAVELRAFTTLSAGLRSLTEAKRTRRGELYDHAYATLCRADGLLAEAEHRADPKGPTVDEWAALRDLARVNARAARTDAVVTAPRGGGTLARPPAGVNVGDCGVSPPDPSPPTPAGTGGRAP
jgi:hypothetical protein